MKLGCLVRYRHKSFTIPEKHIPQGTLGVVTDVSSFLWGVQWLGVDFLRYHFEHDLEVVNESR